MEDKRKRYEITCPHCGKIQYACKSLFHNLGIDSAGHGTCLKCKGFMRLIFNEESQTMRSEKLQAEGEWIFGLPFVTVGEEL